MADLQPPLSNTLASQEARRQLLLRERRSGQAETGEPVMYGPTPVDVDSGVLNVPFAGQAARKLHDRGLARIEDMPSRYRERDSNAVNKIAGRQDNEWQREGLLRRDRNRDAQKPKSEGGLSLRDAVSLAKGGTPAGLAAGGTKPGGATLSPEQLKQMIGRGLIKASWASLWLTFGHSIYVIAILFFAAGASKYLRQYIPEVGTEWVPQELLSRMPEHVLIPIKRAEAIGIVFLLFTVLLFDILIFSILGFVVAMIVEAKSWMDIVT